MCWKIFAIVGVMGNIKGMSRIQNIFRMAAGTLIISFFVSFIQTTFAQEEEKNNFIPPLTGLKFSFNESLIFPGLGAGIEFRISTAEIIKIRRSGKKKVFIRDRIISLNPAWYHHPGFHDNLYISVNRDARRIRPNGIFSEFSAGAGYSRTFLGGTTYKVSDQGEISVKKRAGYNYALVVFGEKTGYDFSKTGFLPFSGYISIDFLVMFPYNSAIYIRPVLCWGILIPVKKPHIN